MSRRRGMAIKTGQALGARFGTALQEIDKRFFRTVEATCPITLDPEALLHALFPSECIETMRRAYPWGTTKGSYSHEQYDIDPSIKLAFPDWRVFGMQAPDPEHLCVIHGCPVIHDLREWFEAVEKVRHDWAVVRKVVKYVHEECKPSAVRYFFPAIFNLIGADDKHEAARGFEPKDLGQMLPLIRRATNVIAASNFLPPPTPRPATVTAIANFTFAERKGAVLGDFMRDGDGSSPAQFRIEARIVAVLPQDC